MLSRGVAEIKRKMTGRGVIETEGEVTGKGVIETEGEVTGRGVIETEGEVTGRGVIETKGEVIETKGEVTGRGVIETKGEVTGRGVIKEGVGVGLVPESDIDKEKLLIGLKEASETAQWMVGFNILDVALLEVGKALWNRTTCPLEDRAKLWETVQLWVLSKLLTRKRPTEEELTWLLEELDPWDPDPSEQEHLQSEIRSLFEAVGSLLTSTTNLDPAPQGKGPRLLPLLRRGLYWASYTSFTAQEREEQRGLHRLLCRHSKEVSETLSARALGDLSRLRDVLGLLRAECDEQTKEVVAKVELTLDGKRPEPKEEAGSHRGTQQLSRRTPKPGCAESGDVENGSRSQSGRLQQKQTVWKSRLWNNACFWKWTALVFLLIYLITFAVVIFKSSFGPSANLVRNDNGCYRTDWMPSMNKYFWNKEETDWNTSSRFCQEKNGTLAVLHDERQLNELLKEYGKRYPWIGLHKLNEEFQWVDGTCWNSTVFRVNGYGDCVYLRKDVFSVNECSIRRSSLCRRKPCD